MAHPCGDLDTQWVKSHFIPFYFGFRFTLICHWSHKKTQIWLGPKYPASASEETPVLLFDNLSLPRLHGDMKMVFRLHDAGDFSPLTCHSTLHIDQIRSVAQLCLTLCDPMNRSMPGLPVHHQIPEFTQTHIHRVSDAIQPSRPLLSPSLPAFNLSQHQGLF